MSVPKNHIEPETARRSDRWFVCRGRGTIPGRETDPGQLTGRKVPIRYEEYFPWVRVGSRSSTTGVKFSVGCSSCCTEGGRWTEETDAGRDTSRPRNL